MLANSVAVSTFILFIATWLSILLHIRSKNVPMQLNKQADTLFAWPNQRERDSAKRITNSLCTENNRLKDNLSKKRETFLPKRIWLVCFFSSHVPKKHRQFYSHISHNYSNAIKRLCVMQFEYISVWAFGGVSRAKVRGSMHLRVFKRAVCKIRCKSKCEYTFRLFHSQFSRNFLPFLRISNGQRSKSDTQFNGNLESIE